MTLDEFFIWVNDNKTISIGLFLLLLWCVAQLSTKKR